MIPGALAAALERRFTFVVGKGGVGKTTTAAALALWRADGGASCHLLSTDPAHSLGDVFGQRVGPGTAPAACAASLVLEELDAETFASAWMARAGEPLAELVERGTYLRPEEVRGFLRLAYPGVDEVAAALRLAELADEAPHWIVVDTAPTGHLLRLLDAGELLAGWVSAFDAMRAKAAAVAEVFARRKMELAADDVLRELAERIERFHRGVLEDADFVLVSAPGVLVERETERLRRDLGRRGLHPAATVLTGAGPPPPRTHEVVVSVPSRPLRPGCEDLRRWGDSPEAVVGAERPAGPPRVHGGAGTVVIRRLLAREILLVAGKGGVGKSTCAAALALALAAERSVSLLGADPAGSLADVLGRDVPSGGLALGERLEVRELDAEAELRAFRDEHRQALDEAINGIGLARAAELDRRVMDRLWSLAPPGMDEIFALVQLMEAAGSRDSLLVDSAPTGHFLRLVRMPDLARDWTRQLIRLMLNTRELTGLDRFGERLLTFSRRVRALAEALADPLRAGVLLVTLPEPVVASETRRLAGKLSHSGVPIAAVLYNRLRADGLGSGASLEDPGSGMSWSARLPRILAPAWSPPPVGGEELMEFFESWRLA